MEFVKEENLVQHHVEVLQQCAYDLSKVTGDRVRFAETLEDGLIWHLNDWALDDYKDFVVTLMHCIDLYNQGKPTPTAEDIVKHTYDLAELISLNAQAQAEADAKAVDEFYRTEAEAEVREFCSNLGNKASEVLEAAKAALPDELKNLSKDELRAKATAAGKAAQAAGKTAGGFLKEKLSTYGAATAGWFMSQLTQEFNPDAEQQNDGGSPTDGGEA